ncbi:MAG: helix-turn-helix transcriptional regulator [Actinomycetia bacterium]|nr:helix-turn-helix transcriptional regulator [Actinomycetes bacterium]
MSTEPTRAEARVLDYVARGKSNKEIARALVIEVGTVKRHLFNVYPKLGARNRTQAALIWRRRSELREVA